MCRKLKRAWERAGFGVGRQSDAGELQLAGREQVYFALGWWAKAGQRGKGEKDGLEGEDLAVFTQHPPGHFSYHQPQSQATWLSWKQDGIEQMVSTSQIPIKQGRDGSGRGVM